MSDMLDLLERFKVLKAEVSQAPKLRWGVVTSVSPLQVRFEEDSSPILGTPASLVHDSSLEVGMRVELLKQNNRIVIQGVGGGIPIPEPPEVIPLPPPQTVGLNGGNGNVGGSGGVFEAIPGMPQITFTTPKPLYVSVDFGANCYAYNGYIMFGVATSGDFVSTAYHQLGKPANIVGNYGAHTPFMLNVGQRPEVSLVGVKKMLIPEGTTVFTLQRLRSATGIVAVSAYPSMSVAPITWAE